jgi:translation initiation factor IF-3
MLGIYQFSKAMDLATSRGLDLVEISPNAEPPVCKIMDFGKFKYEAKKKIQEAKKKQRTSTLKEIKFRPNIGTGDFEIKVKNILKFLEDGDKVKVSMMFRGREIVHNEQSLTLFKKVIEFAGETVKIESEPRLEGKQMMMILAPAKIK